MQTISGTGAVHLGALFLSKFYHPNTKRAVYFSNPTWVNHHQIFSNVHLPYHTHPYFSTKTKGLDFEGMIEAIEKAPEGNIILLHACAHNPTGVDPTQEQWKEICKVMQAKKQFPFFDCAYQGFASGNLNKDAWAVRYFVDQGFELCIAQSYPSESVGAVIGDTSRRKSDEDIYVSCGSLQTRLVKDYCVVDT